MPKLEIQGMCPLIQVFDMPAAVEFYTEILEFEILDKSDPGEIYDWVWLRRGGLDLMLNTLYEAADRPAAPDPSRTAAHSDTGLFFNCPDVDAIYRHLLDEGLVVEPPVIRPFGVKQLFAKDPDGYALCFQWATDAQPEPVE